MSCGKKTTALAVLAAVAIVLLLPFQNCSHKNPVDFRVSEKGGNGNGYEGKTYIVADRDGTCKDTDTALSRIATSKDGQRFFLVRQDCAVLEPPKELGVGEILHPDPIVAGSDYVIFDGMRFEFEGGTVSARPTSVKVASRASYEASGANEAQFSGVSLASTGYNKPSVLEVGDKILTSAFYPCSSATPRIGCFRVLRIQNGMAIHHTAELNLGVDFGDRAIIDSAVEAPVLIARGDEIIAAYLVGLSAGTNQLRVVRAPLDGTGGWSLVASHATTAQHLGGALARDGAIYLAANVTTAPAQHSLGMFRLPPGGGVLEYSTKHGLAQGVLPSTPHVAVDAGGRIRVTSSYGHDESCGYRTMRNILEMRGFWSDSPFARSWEFSATDYSQGTSGVPDHCSDRYMRFASDFIVSGETTYTIVRVNDPIGDDQAFSQSDLLFVSGSQGAAKIDVTSIMRLVTDQRFSHLSLTKIGDRFAIVGGFGSKIAVALTKDLKNFEGPFVFDAPNGSGSSIRLNQPWKNGSTGSRLILWFHGESENNNYLRFNALELSVE